MKNIKFLEKVFDCIPFIFQMLIIPLALLNALGGFVSGLWLIILGLWHPVILGILYGVFSSYFICLLLLPTILIGGIAAILFKKNKILGMLFGFINILYIDLLMALWCIWILYYFMGFATYNAVIPMLIWSYGVAFAPWLWLSYKDQQSGNNSSLYSIFFAETAYIIAIIMSFMHFTLGAIFVMFLSIMILSSFCQISIAFIIDKKTGCI